MGCQLSTHIFWKLVSLETHQIQNFKQISWDNPLSFSLYETFKSYQDLNDGQILPLSETFDRRSDGPKPRSPEQST